MLDIARSKYINAESASVKAHVFFFYTDPRWSAGRC